ncbi:hypothetical protein EJB05_52588 [Eragrostis curvula]|uniref:Uncharacterized protein n=1 Tax=Eragrostis curvula TaxID=38414 RepID=A0A5J9SSM3_9POAL|nr:hypothetical protein EJB05_52588 [Eragrostis curvula]
MDILIQGKHKATEQARASQEHWLSAFLQLIQSRAPPTATAPSKMDTTLSRKGYLSENKISMPILIT